MSDDVLIAKAASLERCVRRAREELVASPNFRTDVTRQDAAILNVQRACELSVDMAFRVVRVYGLGAPATNREAFDLLVDARLIGVPLALSLKRMVGFRNVAVYRYTELDMAVVESVIRLGLEDLLAFSAIVLGLPAGPAGVAGQA